MAESCCIVPLRLKQPARGSSTRYPPGLHRAATRPEGQRHSLRRPVAIRGRGNCGTTVTQIPFDALYGRPADELVAMPDQAVQMSPLVPATGLSQPAPTLEELTP